jgi:hypothetical protein
VSLKTIYFPRIREVTPWGYETFNVMPVTPRIGAEVNGLTLAKPLSNRQVEELHQALADHQVLFFRDQPLDVESHKAFGRYFGDLHIHPNTPGPDGHPEILPIHADANSKRIAGEYWHSDVSCDDEPPLGSILYLHTVPPVGGDTSLSAPTFGRIGGRTSTSAASRLCRGFAFCNLVKWTQRDYTWRVGQGLSHP